MGQENSVSKMNNNKVEDRLFNLGNERYVSLSRGVQTYPWAHQASCLTGIGDEVADLFPPDGAALPHPSSWRCT
jgi:hypothetical protein